jgi:uncharacterized protein YbjT (DUF2867 family)
MKLVVGGTGTIGGEVLRQLSEADVAVRALVRSEARADRLGGRADDVVVADLADQATLRQALDGVDGVFVATPGAPDQLRLESNLVEAVAASDRPAHLVKLAALGYDAVPPEQGIRFGATHARVVQRIRELDVPHTVLAPSGFMTNFLGNAGTVRENRAIYGSAGDGAISWIDPVDVGAVAVHVLTSGGHDGASYALTGPELLTFAQVAQRLSTVVGQEVQYVDLSPEAFEQALRSAGVDDWTATALTELHQVYRAHQAEVVTDEVEKATGRAPTSLEAWLEEHRGAFA